MRRRATPRCAPRGVPRRRQAGFTLLELLVVVVLVVMLMLGLLQVFERNSMLAKTQTQVAEMQQGLRTSQNLMSDLVRMTGRGGLPALLNDGGVAKLPALNVRDNVGGGLEVVPGLVGGPTAVAGTDILTVRGVFSTSIFQVNTVAGTLTLLDAGGFSTSDSSQAVTGTLVVTTPSPAGRPQPLDDLNDAIGLGLPEALILVSSIDESIYAVVELDPGSSAAGPTSVTLAFNVAGANHPEYRELYRAGTGRTPTLPTGLTSVAWVGILEEYRFYVRDADPAPMLSMARMFPATETPHGGNASATLDVAENVRELQVALGFDTPLGDALVDRNGDGQTNEDDVRLTETEDGSNDDWLFNGDDDPTASPWAPPWDDDDSTPGIPPPPKLYYVRLNTLVRTRSPILKYQAPTIPTLENAVVAPLNTFEERLHRRQLLSTIIDLRNIS